MHSVTTERVRLVVQLERSLDRPLIVLSLVWVALAAVEIVRELNAFGRAASTAIWIIFIVDFALKLMIAPGKIAFIRRNWINVLALMLPAFRLLRIGRAFRVARGLRSVRLARLLSSMNRGMRALRRGLRRHAIGYVVAATVLVLGAASAGMMAFEREGANAAAFDTYSESLWWTAMLMTTIASEHWPRTGAGRALSLFVSLYAIGVFSYITATLASLLVGGDRRPSAPTDR